MSEHEDEAGMVGRLRARVLDGESPASVAARPQWMVDALAARDAEIQQLRLQVLGLEGKLADPRLKRAIRAFTVDAGTPEKPEPNGPAEEKLRRLCEALRALPLWQQHVAALMGEYLDADVARTTELRQAASAFFGEDLQRPEAAVPARELASNPLDPATPNAYELVDMLFATRAELAAERERVEHLAQREAQWREGYGAFFPGGEEWADPVRALKELAEKLASAEERVAYAVAFMERRFGNAQGHDWSDDEAAHVADVLEGGVAPSWEVGP